MPGRNAAPLLRASAAAGSAAVKRAVAARPGLPRRLRSPTDPAFAAAAAALAPARLHALSAARDGLREQDRGRRAGARGRRGRPAAAAAAAAAAEEGAALARLARPRPAGRRQHPRVPAGAARGGAAHLLRGHHGAHPQHGLPGPQGPAVDAAGVRGHGRYRLFFFLISIVICFVVTKSLLVTCCLPIFLMGMRYYFSRKVILSYLECALNTDMSDIEQYYMKSPEIPAFCILAAEYSLKRLGFLSGGNILCA
ncbi:N-acetylaspartate synthetase isoform X3 [Paroedura picta]|uniref:N-acetylaspartate synthetase isoform X3 n=1 Tax=Paroedura picta TaxID=143630 RepID=UPI00405744AF